MSTITHNKSFFFIVPFLNGGAWLKYFINHYKPILSRHENNIMVLVEGATSFHDASESRGGLSVDNSPRIIERTKDQNITHVRKGQVGQISDLMESGMVYLSGQDYIWPLDVTEFIDYELFDNLQEIDSEAEVMVIPRVDLKGDLKTAYSDCYTTTAYFLNVEGLKYKNGDKLPYFGDVRIDKNEEFTTETLADVRVLNTLEVENLEQNRKRELREEKYQTWYQSNVDNSKVLPKRGKLVEYSNKLPPVLEDHPWAEKSQEEIWGYPITFPYFFDKTDGIVPKTGERKGNILEIGPATGQSLIYYQSRGWKAVGIEPSLWASGYGKHILDLDLRTGTVMDHDFNDGEFSAIVLWDSLEHILNPIETLQRIRGWLSVGGKLIIYTPDYDKFKDDKSHWLWSPRQHQFLYTPGSLRAMLEKTGYAVVKTDRKIDPNGFIMVGKRRIV